MKKVLIAIGITLIIMAILYVFIKNNVVDLDSTPPFYVPGLSGTLA